MNPKNSWITAILATATCVLGSTACGAENPPSNPSANSPATKEASSTMGVAAIDAFIDENKIDKTDSNWKLRLPKPPKVAFESGQKIFWLLKTNKGNIKVELMPDVAPMHVGSTIYLTNLGFYDGTPFHRVITGFMAQGGDPTGSGRGGPGYNYSGEFDPKVTHDTPGLLSMANAGPGTDGSQFFLTFEPTPWLDGKHTIFGKVVEGMGTVKALESAGSRGGQPSEPLQIESARIEVE